MPTSPAGSGPGPPPRRRRDRRGRGLRGPVAPRDLPLTLTRAERFDELVLTSVSRLERRWADQLDAIEVAVEDVPDPGPPAASAPARPVALGRAEEATGDRPARIVVYRRAVEARSGRDRARESLVHEVVVEQLAALLGLDPETVDPDAAE